MVIPRILQLEARVTAPKLVVVLALAATLAAAALQAPAAAQPLSAGCEEANSPGVDGSYNNLGFTNTFFAGERLSVTATAPATGAPTQLTLFVNLVQVGAINFPGTILYTFPVSGSALVTWSVPLPATATWTVTCTAAVAATFRGLSATNTRQGVLVRWRTASEVDALGFDVYRAVQGKRVRVNPRLIAAHGVGAYSFLDRLAPRAKSVRYWIQLVNMDGSRTWYGPARVARP